MEKELKTSYEQAKFMAMQAFAETTIDLKDYFLKSTRPDLITQLLDGFMEVFGQGKGSHNWCKFFFNEDQHHYVPPCFRQTNNRLDDMSYK